jgi:hypothetical protein
MRLEGYLVSARADVREDFYGIRSSAVQESNVRGLIRSIYPSLRTFLAGQVCHDWQSWGEYLGINSILGQSLLHSFAYILLSVRARCSLNRVVTSIRPQITFAASAAVLVIYYAP